VARHVARTGSGVIVQVRVTVDIDNMGLRIVVHSPIVRSGGQDVADLAGPVIGSVIEAGTIVVR
jgi:hypothetical protein